MRDYLVIEVEADGPAAAADTRVGDVITTVGGRRVRDLHEYHDVLWRRRPGDAVDMAIDRDGDVAAVRVLLGTDGARPTTKSRPPQ